MCVREWEREVVREVYSSEARERMVGSGSVRRGVVWWRSYYGLRFSYIRGKEGRGGEGPRVLRKSRPMLFVGVPTL